MFKIKFPTKRIFRILPILGINGMAPFCNLFMERPSYLSFMQHICVLCYIVKSIRSGSDTVVGALYVRW